MILKRRAQSFIEYALIFAAVAAAAVAMGIYVRRSANAKLERTAIGLNAVVREMNAPGASGSGSRSYESPAEPVKPAQLSTAEITNWLNSGDFARGVDLLGQAQDAIANEDIARAQDLIALGLALINEAPFDELKGAASQLDSNDKGVPEIKSGVNDLVRGVDLANQALVYLSQAAGFASQAAGFASQAADFASRAAAEADPVKKADLLRQEQEARTNEATALANKAASLANAASSLADAINSFNSGRSLINTGLALMNAGEDVNGT